MAYTIPDPLDVAWAILEEAQPRRRPSDVDVMRGVDARNARALARYEREQDRLQAEADAREALR